MVECAAYEGCGGVTEGAIERRRNVIRRHAGCGNTMARRAVVHNTGVIERGRDEAPGVMTDTTILIGRNMVDCFACGQASVMTRRAVVNDADVIERCRQKTRGHVAAAAIAVGRHMVVGFSWSGIAIVT